MSMKKTEKKQGNTNEHTDEIKMLNECIQYSGGALPDMLLSIMKSKNYDNFNELLINITPFLTPSSLALCLKARSETLHLQNYEREFDRLDNMGIFSINEIEDMLEEKFSEVQKNKTYTDEKKYASKKERTKSVDISKVLKEKKYNQKVKKVKSVDVNIFKFLQEKER